MRPNQESKLKIGVPMKPWVKAVLKYLLFTLTLFALSSCSVTVGNTEALIRPATRIPARLVDIGNGEKIVLEELEPPGNSLFLLIRGQW